MTFPSCAQAQVSRCTAARSRQLAAATLAWTASKDRAAAPHFPQREPHPITIMSPARHTEGSWTKISMGARAHTPRNSASTAPVKRSALGPQGRPTGDRAPPLALDHNEWSEDEPPTT
jgi:hypothetical protein